jgi:hypothetical protein
MQKFNIGTWQEYIAQVGVEPLLEVEKDCWAPWLAASAESMESRASVFPAGQLCVAAGETVLASLSINQIDWDYNPATLPCWDDVAGEPTDYSQTYTATGNTLTLMSMNVSKQARGMRLPSLLIEKTLSTAAELGVKRVIGSFRPSEYGSAVLKAIQGGQTPPSFENYVDSVNAEGLSVDKWLRSLQKNGMFPIAIDNQAMTVKVSGEEFEALKQSSWQEIELNAKPAWFCGETGFFFPGSDGSLTYKEKNVWGNLK